MDPPDTQLDAQQPITTEDAHPNETEYLNNLCSYISRTDGKVLLAAAILYSLDRVDGTVEHSIVFRVNPEGEAEFLQAMVRILRQRLAEINPTAGP